MPPETRPPVLLHPDHLPEVPQAPQGWRCRSGFDMPGSPWDLSDRRIAAVGSIDDQEAAAAALEALTRGVALVVHVGVSGDLRHRVLEDLHRLGDVSEVSTDPGRLHVNDDDRRLLDALCTGSTVAEAARELHISLRTANRRLGAIRARFGVGTTAEVVTLWAAERH